MPEPEPTVTFTLEDVNTWLGCSREAGRKVWLDSDFAKNMSYFATGQALKKFSAVKLAREIPHNPVEGIVETLNDMSFALVLEYQVWIKANKTLEDFLERGLGGFINLVKTVIPLRFMDRLIEYFDTGSLDQSQDKDKQIPQGELVVIDPSLTPEEKIISDDFLDTCRRLAADLLDQFASTQLTRSRALDDRLRLLRQISSEDGIQIILFLEENSQHLQFQNQAKRQLGSQFNQNTWNSANRRLRIEWQRFLEHLDQKKRAELEDCITCLSQVICSS